MLTAENDEATLEMAKQLGLRIAPHGEAAAPLSGPETLANEGLGDALLAFEGSSNTEMEETPNLSPLKPEGHQGHLRSSPAAQSAALRPMGSLADGRSNSEPLEDSFVRHLFGSQAEMPLAEMTGGAAGKRGRLQETAIEESFEGHGLTGQDISAPSSLRRRLLPGDARRLEENLRRMSKGAAPFVPGREFVSLPNASSLLEEAFPEGFRHIRNTTGGEARTISRASVGLKGRKPSAKSLFNRFLLHRNTWDAPRDGIPIFGDTSANELGADASAVAAAASNSPSRLLRSCSTSATAGDCLQDFPAVAPDNEPAVAPDNELETLKAEVQSLKNERSTLAGQLQDAQLQLAASRVQAKEDAARIAALEKQIESTQQQVGSWRKLYLETLPGGR